MFQQKNSVKLFSILMITLFILQITFISANINSNGFNAVSDSNIVFEHIPRLMGDSSNHKFDLESTNVQFSQISDENTDSQKNGNKFVDENPVSYQNLKTKYSGLPLMDSNNEISDLEIIDDNNLITTAQANSWMGSGNKYDPIIIENYNFTGILSGPNRLYMHNITLHFVIRNCYFLDSDTVVKFVNCSNGIVKGNIIEGGINYGLFLDNDSDNNVITYNNFLNTLSGGLNAYDNDSDGTNHFSYNFWDNHPGGYEEVTTGYGVYEWSDMYNVNGSAGSDDNYCRINQHYWNTKQINFWDDQSLDNYAYLTGVLGNGTKDNPYLITNLNLTLAGMTEMSGFNVQNTNKHVIFKNCYLECIGTPMSAVHGLYIMGASNITFCNSTIINFYNEVDISFSASNIIIYNVTIQDAERNGINAQGVSNISISDCIVTNAGTHGMFIAACGDINISNCEFIESRVNGIYTTSRSSNIQVTDSILFNNSCGIDFSSLSDSLIRNCNISFGDDGISLDGTSNCEFEDNNIFNCTDNGLDFYSESMPIFDNNFQLLRIYNCTVGVSVVSYWTEIVNNSFEMMEIRDCTTGIYFLSEEGEAIYNNEFQYFDLSSMTRGILFSDTYGYASCYNNSFDSFSINNTSANGVDAMNAIKTSFTNSLINNSGLNGMWIDNSNDTTIINANIEKIGSYALYMEDCNNIILNNVEIKNTRWRGIDLLRCNNGSILDPDISKVWEVNGQGIEISYCNNFTITNPYTHDSLGRGITGSNSAKISIDRATIRNQSSYGMFFYQCSDYLIENSEIAADYSGIYFSQGVGNNISNNVISKGSYNGIGISYSLESRILNNIIFNCTNGVNCEDTSECLIYNNSISNNNFGIKFWGELGCQYNEIKKNNITLNKEMGIYHSVGFNDNNTYFNNRIMNNSLGVAFTESSVDNLFYYNYIVNNTVWDNGTSNDWDNGTHGNFWSNYLGVDEIPPFGIGDSPHPVLGTANAFDNYPLVDSVIAIQNLGILLLSPENTSIITSEVNISLTINASTCLYNWDDNSNSTMAISSPTIFIPPIIDGLHSLEIYISNASGHWIYLYLEYTIDNTVPIIESSDVENDKELGTGELLTFTVNDTNLEGFWYSWNESELVYTPTAEVLVPETPGTWVLQVYANDTAGNIATQTLILEIFQSIDLELRYPDSGELIYGYCYITWISSEDVSVNISYSPDNGETWILIADSISRTYYFWNTRLISDGIEYLVRIVSTTAEKPGSDISTSVFSIDNSDLDHDTEYYNLPSATVNITLLSPTNITINEIINLEEEMLPNSSFFDTGLFIEIIIENKSALKFLAVSFNYTEIEGDLISGGFNVTDLLVYFYNTTTDQWELADNTIIDEINKIIYGYFNHTTVIGVLGKSQSTTSPSSPGDSTLLVFIVITVLMSVIGGAGLIYEHQVKIQQGKPSILQKLQKFLEETRKKIQKDE